MGSKYTPSIHLLTGLLVTLLLICLTLAHTTHEFKAVYQKKAQAVFASSQDMFLQHRIMLDALRSFFHASEAVSPQEFEIFAKDLLMIKSALAFTLRPDLQLAYLSDPSRLSELQRLQLHRTEQGELQAQLMDYLLVSLKIDEPNMPYLIYAISQKRILTRIDLEQNICVTYQFEHSIVRSSACDKPPAVGFWRLFTYSDEQFVVLSEYQTQFNLQVYYQVPRAEVIEILVIILSIASLGLAFSVLWFVKAKHRQVVQRIECENRSKLALLASINHEIRTPINALLGYSKLLKKTLSRQEAQLRLHYVEQGGDKALSTIVDKMIWSANLLYSVAENTLNYSKAEVGKLQLDQHPVNLREYVERIQEYYRAFNSTSGKTLSVTISDTLPDWLVLDGTKLFQLITNIINNAFKYSTGEQVHCYMDLPMSSLQVSTSPMLRILIRDFGEGMSWRAKQALDEPFNHQSVSSHGISGMGLGLYTCKRLLEQIGGKLRLRSQEGQGTTVLLRFPCQLHCGVPVPTNHYAQQSLLLVDDNLFNLEICRSALESHFSHIHSADRAEEALRLFSTQRPSIVIVDYRLKDTDGLALIKQMVIAQAEDSWACQFFMLSANDRHEIRDLAQFPEVIFMQKPFSLEVFFSKLAVV
ncbi:hybrid sensor histidine kinase/response regulator [Shewanella mangrovisoli]|uniref:hybrid sensor histidine kinase/response regulator n=1 Tax=Shewanella mangrovisoli TaxID=2864211 RepID=UPI001C6616EF|nr:ATP-binding protein [Shewanella mangrovisoli]QYK07375.1 response regulator [Shewanella mangrovisoli]